jgi:hypothetical protein
VKSTINGETTLFVNGIYELNTTTNQVTKYRCNGKSMLEEKMENKRRTD